MDGEIASFHWEACKSCLHRLEEVVNGSTCEVTREDWEFRLVYDMDTVICGKYEEEI